MIYLANLVSFSLLFVLIDAVSNIEDFLDQSDGILAFLLAIATSYAAVLPVIFCQILGPVVAVSAALFTITTLQRANEFTPILASGRSYQRTLLPVVVGSLVVSVGAFLLQELWIPRTADMLRSAAVNRSRASSSTSSAKATTSSHRYSNPVSGSTAIVALEPSQFRNPERRWSRASRADRRTAGPAAPRAALVMKARMAR